MNKLLSLSKRYKTEFEQYSGYHDAFHFVVYLFDYLLALLIYGASINDYFAFGFFKLRPKGRNEYITYRRYHKILNKCNQKEYIKFFRDKSLFNQRYAKYLHRESLDVSSITEEEFSAFFEKHKEVFVKEVLGFRGKSVWFYRSEETEAKELYRQLKEDKNGRYVIESKLSQHEALSSFHPASVNSIRIITVYDEVADIVHIMFAKIRIGNNGSHLDNTHAGGISGNIDLETGIINTPGYSVLDKKEYVYHPTTGKQIIGAKIPCWKECKEFVEEVARITPEVRYVGWDIVILPDGKFALIEANDNADHDGQQIRYKGMWQEYKKILKQLK
jgi:glutathione synthase/RimK-type ligase-like ATP-grasp enzyme